uniref:Uncharacterized protein n=1 Tax=Lactuca sativa TaxID=4236 RepID=A0A9R1WEM6_LACSA|nr:hypothetical protein LSAT_V11C200060060 [Lactuca sativa]
MSCSFLGVFHDLKSFPFPPIDGLTFWCPTVFDFVVVFFPDPYDNSVILTNATTMPFEFRFDIPFGVSPKILDPVCHPIRCCVSVHDVCWPSAGTGRVETSFYHIDSSHDLSLTFDIRWFRASVLKFSRPLYVTMEKVMDAFSGAREICIFVLTLILLRVRSWSELADPTLNLMWQESLVSTRFDEPGWQWSGCFFPEHLGDTQVKIRNYVTGDISPVYESLIPLSRPTVSMVRVEVQNADDAIRDDKIVGNPHRDSGTNLIL